MLQWASRLQEDASSVPKLSFSQLWKWSEENLITYTKQNFAK